MDCVKIGNLIAKLRKEKNLTQKNIADALGIQNKTVSKWECGLGCPDLSLWPELSAILGVDMKPMMEGEITSNKPDSGNIDKIRFYVCPSCGNILVSTGSASIFCCGRKLERILPTDATIAPLHPSPLTPTPHRPHPSSFRGEGARLYAICELLRKLSWTPKSDP